MGAVSDLRNVKKMAKLVAGRNRLTVSLDRFRLLLNCLLTGCAGLTAIAGSVVQPVNTSMFVDLEV